MLDLLPVRLEGGAQLRGERREVLIDALDAAVVGDEPGRRLLADAGHAGDVVRRVALQRLVVDHLVGPQAESLHDLFGVVDDRVLETLAGGHEVDVRCDQLQGVEVAREDQGVETRRLRLLRERADHVVGLEARERIHGHPELVEELLAALELGPQVVGHRLARRLIGRVALLPEGRDGQIETGRDVARRVLLDDLQQDGREAERRVHQLALRRREGRDREVAAVDEAVGICEEKALWHMLSIAEWVDPL